MSKIRLSFLLPLLAFGILALVGAVALYATLSGSRDPAQLPSVLVNKSAPRTNLASLMPNDAGDNMVQLAAFRGQPFW